MRIRFRFEGDGEAVILHRSVADAVDAGPSGPTDVEIMDCVYDLIRDGHHARIVIAKSDRDAICAAVRASWAKVNGGGS